MCLCMETASSGGLKLAAAVPDNMSCTIYYACKKQVYSCTSLAILRKPFRRRSSNNLLRHTSQAAPGMGGGGGGGSSDGMT